MSERQPIRVGRRTFEVSNLHKVLFPDDGITKGDLIEHYERVAELMLPHVKQRPAAMERYPDGIRGPRIFHKDVPDYFPDWIGRVRVRKAGGSLQQVVCSEAATLTYLANQACITPHVFLSRVDRIDEPDQMIFDLDPPGEGFDDARKVALSLRGLLDELALPSFVKTTGGKGLHVVVPLDRSAGFDEVRTFARDVADVLIERDPDNLTRAPRKERRGGRLFLDVMRNAYAQTAAPPYAVRARPGAPIATPLDWTEVEDRSLRPSRFTMSTIGGKLERDDDPWRGFRRRGRSLRSARARLDRMHREGSAERKRVAR